MPNLVKIASSSAGRTADAWLLGLQVLPVQDLVYGTNVGGAVWRAWEAYRAPRPFALPDRRVKGGSANSRPSRVALRGGMAEGGRAAHYGDGDGVGKGGFEVEVVAETGDVVGRGQLGRQPRYGLSAACCRTGRGGVSTAWVASHRRPQSRRVFLATSLGVGSAGLARENCKGGCGHTFRKFVLFRLPTPPLPGSDRIPLRGLADNH